MDEVKRKVVMLSLEDLLVPGRVVSRVDKKAIAEILKNLSKLHNEKKLSLYLVSGMQESVVKKKLMENGFDKYIFPGMLHCATHHYIGKRTGIDQKRHMKSLQENPNFNDAYVKVQVADVFLMQGIPRQEIIYFGHDYMTDAFYLHRYCNVDTALLRPALSMNHVPHKAIKGLIFVNPTWADFRKVIYGKKKVQSYAILETMIFSMLKEQLLGDTLLKKYVIKKA